MKFCIEDFFSKCDQIRRNLGIWSNLLKKSLMENFIFCAVSMLSCLTVRSTFENKVLSILVLNIVGVPSSSADCYYKYWRFKSWFHQIYGQLPQNSCKFLVTTWLGIAVGCVGLKRKVIRILVRYFWSATFANMNTSS